jgi:tetratricopeptide (TPR) repeat protein
MRRVFLILIIVALAGVTAGGILWYLHRNTAEKLLARSELALRAKQYDRALELAEAATAKEPTNWHGYYTQALALCSKDQYNEARKLLEEAAKHDPPGVAVELAMADTYAAPARRLLASEESTRQTSVIVDAVAGLRQANDALSQVRAKDAAAALDVQQALGLNLAQIGTAQEALRDRLGKEAQVAATAGDNAGSAAKHKAAQEAGRGSDLSHKQATDVLAAVVKQDPKRVIAARVLIDLCVERNDEKTLAVARQAIMSLEEPPPAAVVRLIQAGFRGIGESADPAAEAKHLEAAVQQLDRIIEKHPGDAAAILARAEVAERSGDLDRAMELAKQVIDSKPDGEQSLNARFLKARVLLAQNKWTEAERELHSLRTENPYRAPIQYVYGRAAHEAGQEEPAREAMRTVTDIEKLSTRPDPVYAAAHRYLAESLLGSGFASGAFSEAKAYYDSIRSDSSEAAAQNLPIALGLYVQTAKATDQVGLARTALDAALKDYASRPDVLLVVHDGYRHLGEKPEAARKALEKAAECTPTAVAGRLAVARAKTLLGQVSEAERVLTDEAGRSPKDARVLFELGRFFALTGRPLQAIEQYRAAVRLDDRTLAYREALADALHESGLHDDCLAECQAILDRSPANATAVRLINLVRLARGQDLLPQSGPGTPTGRSLAQALLSNGRPQQCAEVCLKLLKETPNDAEARLLLGQAYLMLGQDDKCVEQWSAVLKQLPDRLSTYLQLTDIVSRTLKPDAVEAALAAIPGAMPDLVGMAMGWLFDRRGQYDAAAEAYGRVAGRQGAPEDARGLARLFRAQSLARAGHLDQATVELDQLAATPTGRTQALYYKATLLASADRPKEADAILADMTQQAVKGKDAATLERIAALHSRLKQTDKALAVCEQLDKMLPKDARPCLLRADVLAAAGKTSETIACYQQAIERQPGNLRSYAALARAFDAAAKPLEALATLKQLEGLGQTGRIEAIFDRGILFARWGLQSQAVESFEQLAKLGRETDPQLQLVLGQAFAGLGRKDRARTILGAIPEYAPQYVDARQLLAGLEDAEDAKLDVLRQAQKVKPDASALLVQEMNSLLRANRAEDAIKAFQEFSARRSPGSPMPDEARSQALHAMLMTGDLAGAANLTTQAARDTGDPRWRRAAVLIALSQKPESAKALLPEVGAAGPYEASLGLLVAAQTGQPVAPWKNRLDQLQKILLQANPPQSLSLTPMLLAAIATGAKADAEAAVASMKGAGPVVRRAAEELLASSGQNPKAPEEAAGLLKASLASELGMPLLGRAWATQILKARPTCQWAASIILQTAPDAAVSRQVLQMLQPADCLLARMTQARLALEEKRYDRAIELYQSALQAEKGSLDLVMYLAAAFERAGRDSDALPLYRQVWDATQSPIAGNNGAYIVSCMYPKDAAKLAEAQKWAEAAVKAAPDMQGFRDTLGWIAYLQGRNEDALQALRQAVRGLPDSPEVHFHLGQAEAKANHLELARWHLAAAINLVAKLKAGGATPSATALEAADRARQTLSAMEQPKS